MKSIPAAAVLILSALLVPQASAGAPLKATLTLPYDHVLPGVPFDMVVTYTNISSQPVTIFGVVGTLVITFPNGETTALTHVPERADQWNLESRVRLRLAPGESLQRGVSWESTPNWFFLMSFSPGTYGIGLDLHIFDGDRALADIRTSTAMVTLVAPVGIDAELWKRMQEISGGKWTDGSFVVGETGPALADEIIQVHPASDYYPYVLAFRTFLRASKGDMSTLLEAAERFPTSPAHPYLLLAAAHSARYQAAKAERVRDATAVEKYLKLAQNHYSAALATKNLAIRESAERGLRDMTRDLDDLTKRDR